MSTEVKPQKPWAKRPADRVRELSIVLAAVAFSFAFVAATELKGKLAYAGVFFVLIILINFCFSLTPPKTKREVRFLFYFWPKLFFILIFLSILLLLLES